MRPDAVNMCSILGGTPHKLVATGIAIFAIVAMSGVLATFSPAHGASPKAWSAHEKEVVSACVNASNLRDAKPGGAMIEFDDRVAFTAMVIEGRYPQSHMQNQRGRELCLFDKRTRTPFISEADAIVRSKRR